MRQYKRKLTIYFGGLMIIAGLYHFINPDLYLKFIPDWLPAYGVIYLSGIVEITLGAATLYLPTRHIGAKGILIMMVLFLPVHVIDVFRDNPAIGSHIAAYGRVPVQFALIFWAWYIAKK